MPDAQEKEKMANTKKEVQASSMDKAVDIKKLIKAGGVRTALFDAVDITILVDPSDPATYR